LTVELYEVIDGRERTVLTPEGTFAVEYEVRARTVSGIEFSFRIPEAEFSKAEVAKRARAKAERIEEVKAIKE